MTRWVDDEATTAQTFAHEVAHSFGVFHDFKLPDPLKMPNARNYVCGPRKGKGGPDNQIMNYGRPRQSTWSECSNEDFSNYYTRVYASSSRFCLKGKFYLNKDKATVV